jgi:hypothetical protein
MPNLKENSPEESKTEMPKKRAHCAAWSKPHLPVIKYSQTLPNLAHPKVGKWNPPPIDFIHVYNHGTTPTLSKPRRG